MSLKTVVCSSVLVLILVGCVTTKVTKEKADGLGLSLSKSEFFNNHLTGFVLYDPEKGDNVYQWNENKYFNLASNTKLLTYYAGLKLLTDSIPSLAYGVRSDTLFFMGTGDPTFLNPVCPNQEAFDFIKEWEGKLVYLSRPFGDTPFASGWTWEDYQYYYQPERSAFSIYGNTVNLMKGDNGASVKVIPSFFKDFVASDSVPHYAVRRQLGFNSFVFKASQLRSAAKNRIPFVTSDELVVRLLEDTLGTAVDWNDQESMSLETFYSKPIRPLYAYMLKASDNHLAEQIHYLICHEQGFKMNSAMVRDYVQQHFFKDVTHAPIWKDGSGLSRYNLATPQFMVELVSKLVDEVGVEELKSVLPAGGRDGTLRNWYKPMDGEQSYVFGKTGTLSNNHNLTGVITTQSGRDLYFSFMNNNYAGSSRPVKEQMEKVLRLVYEQF